MKPSVYKSTTSGQISDNLGLLSDVISCFVIEERNGKYEIELQYPHDGANTEHLVVGNIIEAAVDESGKIDFFEIYKIQKTNDKINVYGEHISYRLNNIAVSRFTANSAAAALVALKNNSANSNPFTFYTDIVSSEFFEIVEPDMAKTILMNDDNSFLSVYGGEVKYNKWNISFLKNRGSEKNVLISYGINILSANQEINIGETKTSIYPYYYREASGDNPEVYVELPNKIIDCEYASHYPFRRVYTQNFRSDFDDVPLVSQLEIKANEYMRENNFGKPRVSLSVNFLNYNFENVKLCDIVTIYFERLKIYEKAQIIKTKFDVLKERYDSLNIGDSKADILKIIKNIKSQK